MMSIAAMPACSLGSSVRVGNRMSTSSKHSSLPLRSRRSQIVRAEIDPTKEVASVNTTPDAPAVVSTPPAPTPVSPPRKAQAPGFGDAMAFSGPAPEAINGRLAMLAFVAAVGAELASNVTTVDQFKSAPVPVFVAFAVFTVASLIPILSGADLKKTSGPFTPLAEVYNGRAAMLGFVGLLATEAITRAPIF